MMRQQHLTRAQWDREVTKMAGWGAAVRPEQRDDLLDYLSSRCKPVIAVRAVQLRFFPGNHYNRLTRTIDRARIDAELVHRELEHHLRWRLPE